MEYSPRDDARSIAERVVELAATTVTQDDRAWPSPDLFALVSIEAYIASDQLEAAELATNDWLQRSPGNADAHQKKMFLHLANLDLKGARGALAGALNGLDDDTATERFLVALLELLEGSESYERTAREFLVKTSHHYRDYVRLTLFWRLQLEGRDEEAVTLLEERWKQIERATWAERLQEGDIAVWREMLVGYYLDRVPAKDIFTPLQTESTFAASPYGSIGMSYGLVKCEAYFYDALLQEVSGPRASRVSRAQRSLEQVSNSRVPNAYEYHMARYLLAKLGKVQ
jgi:hypothetical protein